VREVLSVEERAKARFVDHGEVEASSLETRTSRGKRGSMVFVEVRGDEPRWPGVRYYFPDDSEDMYRVPGHCPSAEAMERLLADESNRETLLVQR
jgi:hypothetical protein